MGSVRRWSLSMCVTYGLKRGYGLSFKIRLILKKGGWMISKN